MKKINKEKRNKKQKRNDKAITLIALVVTIIILLILAGVTIGFTMNGTGLFEKAKLATDQYNNKVAEENFELEKVNNEINSFVNGGSRYEALGKQSDVLWTGDISSANQTASWSSNIEEYSYLILQTSWSNSKAKQDWLIDITTIKNDGYYETNYSDDNSHMLMGMYSEYFIYVAFTSNKSLIIPKCNGNYVHLINIIGMK